jgi:hypothetical protein
MESQVADLSPLSSMPLLEELNLSIFIFLRIISKHPHAKLVTEWLKVAEFALVMVPGSVEDERLFSIMNLIKNELRNRLKNPLLTEAICIQVVEAL